VNDFRYASPERVHHGPIDSQVFFPQIRADGMDLRAIGDPLGLPRQNHDMAIRLAAVQLPNQPGSHHARPSGYQDSGAIYLLYQKKLYRGCEI
jgi:hypothetical protein